MTVAGDGVAKPPTSERATGVQLIITTSGGDAVGNSDVVDVHAAVVTTVEAIRPTRRSDVYSSPRTTRTR
jgi:hypothetical protein